MADIHLLSHFHVMSSRIPGQVKLLLHARSWGPVTWKTICFEGVEPGKREQKSKPLQKL